MTLQHLRSSTANKRPTPAAMSDGQLAMNTNLASPGLFLKDSNGDLVKVGPVHVGTTAPNATPAVGGQAGNSKGEQWLDTTGGVYVFKIYDGTAWRSETGTFVDVNGDTMTGALGIIAGSAAAPGVFFSGDTNTGIYSPGADQVAVATNGTGRLFIASDGKVAVNTTPTYWLQVVAPAGAQNIFLAGQTGVSNGYQIDSTGSAITHIWNTAGGERVRLTDAGLVGIGTSAPGTLTHLRGTNATTNFTINNPSGLFTLQDTSSSAGAGAKIAFGASYDGTNSLGQAIVGASKESGTGSGADQYRSSLVFHTSNYASGVRETMRLDPDGRVGIGTSAPNEALHIASGGARISSSLIGGGASSLGLDYESSNARFISYGPDVSTQTGFIFLTGNSTASTTIERLRITAAGNVGIGTSSPQAQLQVAAPSAGRSYSSSVLDFSNIHLDGITAGTVTSALTFSSGSGGGAAIAFSRGGSFQTEMSFWTCSTNVANSATQRMVIDSAGSVGIGTTSPNALLDVRSATAWVGDGTTDAFLQFNQSATAANRWHIGAGSGNALIFYKGTYGTGVETTRLDSSGKLLIGTSTAGTAKVSIQGATGNSTYAVEGLSVAVGGDTVNPNGRGVVAEFGAGGVADGAATHGATINLGASSVGLFGIRIIPGSAFAISDYYPGGAYVGAANPPTERMRINNVGNLLVGRTGTDGAALIQAPASSTVPSYGSATGVSTAITHFEFRNSNGLVGTISTNASATAYNTSSDYRLKENVIPVSDGIVRLQQLKPSRFNFIADSDQTVDGFIAHEVQAVVPECVTGEKDAVDEDGNPVYQGIDQSKLVPLLTAALQEAIAKIETLEARLTAAGIE